MSDATKGNRTVMLGIIAGVIVVGAVASFMILKGGSAPSDSGTTPPTMGAEGSPGAGPSGPGVPGVPGGPDPAQAGLGGPAPAAQPAPDSGDAVKKNQAPAGVPVVALQDVDNTPPAPQGQPAPSTGPRVPKVSVVSKPRQDPFALLPVEIAADRAARQQALLASLGGFQTIVVPKPKKPNPKLDPVEKQPYRRLAGIIRGEAVSAILEEEGMAGPLVVKPGDKVGTWTVRSIDNEKMVLTREGKVKPHMLVVRLEAKATVTLDMGGSGAGNTPGGPGGPNTGGRGGRRGGPGGRMGGPAPGGPSMGGPGGL